MKVHEMLEIGKYRIYFGDFHGQWNSSPEELALLTAGLSWHGYDFTAFQTPARQNDLENIIGKNNIPITAFKGRECMYEWGHLATAELNMDSLPSSDDPDYEKVLAWHQNNSCWTILAHPYDFMIDKLEGLLEKELLDAVELVNGFGNENRNNRLYQWYLEQTRKGKKVPIVSGLDIHIPHGNKRPSVLYSPRYAPRQDIDLFSANRCGVICEDCSLEQVKDSMQNCMTFIEISNDKYLIGQPKLVEYLEAHGYWEKTEKELSSRRRHVPGKDTIIIGGQKEEFAYTESIDEIIIDGKSHSGKSAFIPLKFDRNTHYVNMVSKKDGLQTVSALKVYHPLTLEILPDIQNGKYFIILNIANKKPVDAGEVIATITCNGKTCRKKIQNIKPNHTAKLSVPWEIENPLAPSKFEIKLEAAGIAKEATKYLVFTECAYISSPEDFAAWENIVPIKLTGARPEQIDDFFTVSWDGEEDLSAELRMAWNEDALFFRINAKDDALVSSKTNLLMFGDSFQIGLNPVGTEAVGNQSFYDIMMTRGTENGDEKAYMERPVNMALEYPVGTRLLLKGLYRGKSNKNGFEGLLTLPFNMIQPMAPVAGARFGLFLTIFDNDGTGLKTSLQWPLHAERFVNQAWYIPYYGAWASVKMTK